MSVFDAAFAGFVIVFFAAFERLFYLILSLYSFIVSFYPSAFLLASYVLLIIAGCLFILSFSSILRCFSIFVRSLFSSSSASLSFF